MIPSYKYIYIQAERTNYLLRENELNVKADSADSIKVSIRNHEAKIAEFEIQIQNFIAEKNNLESKLEEAEQDLGGFSHLNSVNTF